MAKKTNASNNPKRRQNDAAVYKIMGALLLLVVSVFALNWVSAHYGTVSGAERIYRLMLTLSIVFGALTLAALGTLYAVKNAQVRTVCAHAAVVLALYAVTALVLRVHWTTYIPALTYLHVALYCLYIIYMLYGTEFFLVSLITALSGGIFMRLRQGMGFGVMNIVLTVLLVAVIAGSAWLAMNAAKSGGAVVFRGKKLRVFPARFNPLGIYVTCAVWLICFIACLVIGSAFAYYCMFAAIAYELIAAVYYTFQLK